MEKSIFVNAPKNSKELALCPRVEYSQTDKKKIIDYLYNEQFSIFDLMDGEKHYDAIDGTLLAIGVGILSDDEYQWNTFAPVYIFKYGLKISDDFKKKIERFYKKHTVEDTIIDWEDLPVFRPRQPHSHNRQSKPVDPPA